MMQSIISQQNLVYYRMAGYTATILLHAVNVAVMLYRFQGDVLRDPNIQTFYFFMDKFITCWTFLVQSIHALIGLTCDVLTLMKDGHKEHPLLRFLKRGNDIYFASIVAPFTFTIPSVFWPIFLYDRELIMPTYTTKIVNSISNHIMHSIIVPLTLWNMACQPRERPRSHFLSLLCVGLFTGLYLVVIFKSYFKIGLFPYPILTMWYGTVKFVPLLVFVTSVPPFYYFAQWKIYDLFWGRQNANKKEL